MPRSSLLALLLLCPLLTQCWCNAPSSTPPPADAPDGAASTGPSPRELLELALSFDGLGDWRRAERGWERACDAGSRHACSTLAELDPVRPPGPSDWRAALTLYEGDCRKGELDACDELIQVYARVEGYTQGRDVLDDERATACAEGEAQACLERGLLQHGWLALTEAASRAQVAVDAYTRACELGLPSGCVAIDSHLGA